LPSEDHFDHEDIVHGSLLGSLEQSHQDISSFVAMAPPQTPPRAEAPPLAPPRISETNTVTPRICGGRNGRYEICRGDGMHERWERYRPQQPSFRSRFINRWANWI